MTKKTYITPKLVILGSVRELTQGARYGEHLDQNFTAQTPVGKLLLS